MLISIIEIELHFCKWILKLWWKNLEDNILKAKANAVCICKWDQLILAGKWENQWFSKSSNLVTISFISLSVLNLIIQI